MLACSRLPRQYPFDQTPGLIAGASTVQPAGSALGVVEAGRRTRNQPAPPHVIFEAQTEPNRDPAHPWLLLLGASEDGDPDPLDDLTRQAGVLREDSASCSREQDAGELVDELERWLREQD